MNQLTNKDTLCYKDCRKNLIAILELLLSVSNACNSEKNNTGKMSLSYSIWNSKHTLSFWEQCVSNTWALS